MINTKDEKKIGIVLAYLFLLLNSILGILITPIYINTIGVDEYGLYQMVGSFAAMLLLLDFGMGATSTRYITKYISQKDEYSKENFIAVALLLNIVFSLIIVLVSSIIYIKFDVVFSSINENNLGLAKTLFLVLVINLVVSVFNHTFEGLINAYEKFIFNNTLKSLHIIIRTVIIIIILQSFTSSMVIVIVDLFLTIVLLLSRIFYSKVKLKISAKFHKFEYKYYKEIFIFTFFISLKSISNYLNNSIDKYLVGLLVNTFSVTVYTIAITIYGIFLTLPNTISSVYQPFMSKMIFTHTSKKELTAFIVGTSRKQFIVAGYIMFGFILTGQNFLKLWVGEEFIGAYYVVLILMFSSIIHVCQSLLEISLYALNKHKFSAILNIFMAIANVLISIPLIKIFGYIGAPIGTAIVLIVGKTIIMSGYYQKATGLNVLKIYNMIFKRTLPSLIVSMMLTFIITNHMQNDLPAFLFKGILFTVIFGVIMYYYGFNEDEKKSLHDIFLKISGK